MRGNEARRSEAVAAACVGRAGERPVGGGNGSGSGSRGRGILASRPPLRPLVRLGSRYCAILGAAAFFQTPASPDESSPPKLSIRFLHVAPPPPTTPSSWPIWPAAAQIGARWKRAACSSRRYTHTRRYSYIRRCAPIKSYRPALT